MSDPLRILPYEIFIKCIFLATREVPDGPLESTLVSQHWQAVLVDSPLLWSTIFLLNTEDEISRVSAFLHLSKEHALDVYIRTMLPTEEGLQLLKPHQHRIKKITMRPGFLVPDPVPPLYWGQWSIAISYILGTLLGLMPSEARDPLCIGSFAEDQYHILLTQFAIVSSPDNYKEPSADEQEMSEVHNLLEDWKEYISSVIMKTSDKKSALKASASKHTKFALSALVFEDAETAKSEILKALASIGDIDSITKECQDWDDFLKRNPVSSPPSFSSRGTDSSPLERSSSDQWSGSELTIHPTIHEASLGFESSMNRRLYSEHSDSRADSHVGNSKSELSSPGTSTVRGDSYINQNTSAVLYRGRSTPRRVDIQPFRTNPSPSGIGHPLEVKRSKFSSPVTPKTSLCENLGDHIGSHSAISWVGQSPTDVDRTDLFVALAQDTPDEYENRKSIISWMRHIPDPVTGSPCDIEADFWD